MWFTFDPFLLGKQILRIIIEIFVRDARETKTKNGAEFLLTSAFVY